MPQYRTMGLPKLTGHTDKDVKNLRDLFYQQDEQLRYLFEHLGTDIASEIWENDNQSVKIKIDEDGIIAEIRESLDGDIQTLSTKINITAGKINTTVSRVENIERDYVSDDDIDTVYLSLKTEIDQNAEAIALRATKEYVAESLNGYVTEAELSAELKISSDGVLTTVSKNYVSDETLAGILSEYVTDDDIDTVYLSLKTEIDENAEAIALRATKEYVAESLNGYVTETELAAELKVSADGVLTTVSKSYATTDAVNTAQNTANAAGAAAAGAQNTANSAKGTADAVAANLSNNYYSKTTVDQKFDSITLKYTDSAGNETSFKLTNGAIDITLLKNQVDAAAKTATNFISMTSNGGVEVGNKSGGSWTGYRTQMLADRFCIVDDSDNELASYEANAIYLGKSENKDTVIDFNNGMVTLSYDADNNRALMDLNSIYIFSESGYDVSIGSTEYDRDSNTIGGQVVCNANGARMSGHSGDRYSVDLYTDLYLRFDGRGLWESVGTDSDGYLQSSSIEMWPNKLKIRGQATGSSLYRGRDYALLASTNAATASAYFPVVDCKAQTGDWSMGCLGDNLSFVYTADTNYSAGNNTTKKITLSSDGGLTAGGAIQAGGHLYLPGMGAGWVQMKNYNGVYRLVLGLTNETSDVYLGLGSYNASEGKTYVMAGEELMAQAKGAIYLGAYTGGDYGSVLIGAQSTDRGLELKPETNNTWSLGWGSGRWKYAFIRDIYATYAVHVDSDRRLKKDISYDMSKLSPVFDELRPAIYQFIADEEEKLRMGFIAQDVIEALEKCGYDPNAFAILSETEMENGVIFGLTYEETNALLVYEVQQLKSRVAELEKRCA